MKVLRYLILFISLVCLLPRMASAHQVASVEFEFNRHGEQWQLLGRMDVAYMLPETRKVLGGLPFSREETMKAPAEELARMRVETEKTLRNILRVSFDGKDVPWAIEFPDFDKQPLVLPEDERDMALFSVRLVIKPEPGPGELRVHWSREESAELIILNESSARREILSVLPGGEATLLKLEASGISAPIKQEIAGGWIESGFHHVVPLGLDHMLFILGLFLMVPKWKPLLHQSLMFTLAHSVTLALCVLGWVSLPSRLVEVIIAFSIAFVGVENLFSRQVGKLRLILVLGFGLIHGMGFANVLAEKLDGVPRDRLLGPLLGFNVGVELAQITVLSAAFLILWPLRKQTRQVQTVGSVCVALAGLGWMIERVFFV